MQKRDKKLLELVLYAVILLLLQLIIFLLLNNFTSYKVLEAPYSLPLLGAVNGLLIGLKAVNLRRK
ncbi:MAG: hypothetical protein Q3988_00580 [Gemella sp.]|nr:hypothetical protein [Gemella sp.]